MDIPRLLLNHEYCLTKGVVAYFINDILYIPTFLSLYYEQSMIWLFTYVLAISLYDLRTRRIPNWYTFPLIAAGLIVHFPGDLDLWLGSLILISAWVSHGMGAGDVKLWLAVLWALPVDLSSQALPLMFSSFFLTGLVQILWRVARKQSSASQLTPGAWRTIPFVLLTLYVH
jgi:leader peptidase (prepilin peptidase) / N-methyltransferase